MLFIYTGIRTNDAGKSESLTLTAVSLPKARPLN